MRWGYFLLLCFLLPLPVLAAPFCDTPIVPCGGLDCGFCNFVKSIDNLLCYSTFYLVAPAAFLALVIGGVILFTASGNAAKIAKGKKIVQYVVLGIVIVFASFLIVDALLGNILDLGYIPIWQTFPGCAVEDAEITPLPPPPPAVCGDGSCNGDETCHVCPPDCGECVLPPPFCGDEECNGEEDCFFCPEDCGECEPYCGDGACGLDEDCESCHTDCGWCWDLEFCGDGICNGDDTCENCPADCGGVECIDFPFCGDGICQEESETCSSCPEDCEECAAVCGDGSCWGEDWGETCETCPDDCYCFDTEAPQITLFGLSFDGQNHPRIKYTVTDDINLGALWLICTDDRNGNFNPSNWMLVKPISISGTSRSGTVSVPSKLSGLSKPAVYWCKLGVQDSFGNYCWSDIGEGYIVTPGETEIPGAEECEQLPACINCTTGECGGTPAPCSTYTDEYSCADEELGVEGCIWNEGG